MLLCSVADVEPGMEVGAPVIHPRRPEIELLRPGVKLEEAIIHKLERLGVSELWVQHSATSDLDAAAAPSLSKARTLVFRRIKKDFTKLAFSTVSIAQVHDYRRAISDLVIELMASGRFAHLSQQLFTESDQLFTHSTNVAFLSVLVGLELNPYVVRQRRRLNPVHARDVVPLGLGAMLHDIGKTKLSPDVLRLHEMHDLPDDPQLREEYHRHPLVGYELLAETGAPATARAIVLNHHQRFDGQGWPDRALASKGRRSGSQAETEIHIFSRIVGAANVLDNLMTDAEGQRHPTVAALREFASPRFDGWFDPVVRDLMIRRILPFPIGSLIKLSDERPAVVVTPNFQQPCRPVVRVLEDSKRAVNGEYANVDLRLTPDLHISYYAGQRVDQFLFELPERHWWMLPEPTRQR